VRRDHLCVHCCRLDADVAAEVVRHSGTPGELASCDATTGRSFAQSAGESGNAEEDDEGNCCDPSMRTF
jgi:hypothetical protein